MKRLLLLLAACNSGASKPPLDGHLVLYHLTSPTIEFDGEVPAVHTCKGENTSPALAFTINPVKNAKSYAILLSTGEGRREKFDWIIYDIFLLPGIPAAIPDTHIVTSMPGGAKQARNPDGSFGYRGPCPTTRERVFFEAHQLSVQNLPVTENASHEEIYAQIAKYNVEYQLLQAWASP